MNKYEDMIRLPHHQSSHHPPMPMEERAAQFSPFAALTGYGDVLKESARKTQARRNLTEDEKEVVNRQLTEVLRRLSEQGTLAIQLTYFREDLRKEGGEYVTERMDLKRWDADAEELVTTDRRRIAIADLTGIESIAEDCPERF